MPFSRTRGGGGPARPIPARTPRAGWVAYLWCGFCALPTPRGPRPHPAAGTRLPAVAGMDRPARLTAQKLQASAALTICIVFAHFSLVRAPSATRALPIWSPGGFLGACRSCGQKIAHVLADIAGWDLELQVSSPNFVGPLPATRAVGRCEATDAIPTGTRRRRRIPHRSDRISPRLCVRTAFASARLCRSLLSFAFYLASSVI